MSFSDPRPYDPEIDDPVALRARAAARAARSSLGPGYDWLMELGRQSYRPALGAITLAGLFRVWVLGVPMDDLALGLLVTLAGLFAGFRTAEVVANRINAVR